MECERAGCGREKTHCAIFQAIEKTKQPCGEGELSRSHCFGKNIRGRLSSASTANFTL